MSETRNNRKRKMRPPPQNNIDQEFLADLVKRIAYGGNPEHKRNPGDFGLNPPSSPRHAKTLCDEARIFKRSVAMALLREGVKKGLISVQEREGCPQNIWAVSEQGIGTVGECRTLPISWISHANVRSFSG